MVHITMSQETPIPRTLVYARHIGRELALLSLSSLSQYSPDGDLDEVDLADILERATRLLSNEAEEYIDSSGKSLELIYSTLESFEPEEKLDLVDSHRDLQIYKRNIGDKLKVLKDQLREQAETLSNAVNLLGEALDLPLLRILSDNPHIKTFTLEVVSAYRDNRQDIDALINDVSEEWSIERMNSIDRDLIRMAATEMVYDPMATQLGGDKTPLPVIINEAVELAKKYGTPDSYRFVNAILRNLLPHAEERRRQRR